jgi:hypothetical protein
MVWRIVNFEPLGQAPSFGRGECLIEMSLYWRQISRYRTHFDDDQIKVLLLEDLKNEPGSFFRGFGQFLGVDPDGFDFEEAATPKIKPLTDAPTHDWPSDCGNGPASGP